MEGKRNGPKSVVTPRPHLFGLTGIQRMLLGGKAKHRATKYQADFRHTIKCVATCGYRPFPPDGPSIPTDILMFDKESGRYLPPGEVKARLNQKEFETKYGELFARDGERRGWAKRPIDAIRPPERERARREDEHRTDGDTIRGVTNIVGIRITEAKSVPEGCHAEERGSGRTIDIGGRTADRTGRATRIEEDHRAPPLLRREEDGAD